MLDKHLKQLETELELPESFVSAAPGTWTIPLDDGLDITLTARDLGGFSLSCVLGSMPKENEELFLDKLMLSNLFGQGTDGAILGIDEFEKNLVLLQHYEGDVDYQRFKDILEDFINSADVWRDELAEQQGQG